MKYKIQSKAILFAFILLAMISAQATADLMNGSFETGDLTAWSTHLPSGSGAGAFGEWRSWAPTDGSYLGWLRGPYGGVGDNSRLYQTFEAVTGDTLTFDYFWDSDDTDDDTGRGIILDSTTGSTVTTLFEHSAAEASTPWTTVHYSFAGSGTYTLSFEIHGGTTDAMGYLGADNVILTPIPVPAAILLGVLGLSVAGIKLRKFA